MKKTVLLAVLAIVLSARPAAATITLNATPSTQTATVGGTFNVMLTLSVTQASAPANVQGYDLYFVTSSANTSRFAITAANPTGVFTTGRAEPAGGDLLSMAAATGFVRNGQDQGFINPGAANTAKPTPLTNYPLANFTFSIAAGTPNGTYDFSTSNAANAGNVFFSDVTDNGGNIFAVDTAGTFSITVVPEPSTFGLLALGALGCIGMQVFRRKQARV